MGVDGAKLDQADPGQIVDLLRQRLATPVVLVIDQLEELFTLCQDEQERHCFLAVMDRIASHDGPQRLGVVVYGLRMDAYPQCADYADLRAVLQDGQVIVGPMTEDELRQAILFPAREVGLEVEPGLVELLLRDLGTVGDQGSRYEAGRLPLLAHALRVTWQQRHGHRLTVDGYRATGGIHDAIATSAETVYHRLSPSRQRLTKTLFLRLVKIGDGTDNVRRRLPRADLTRDGADVLDVFTAGRLLTADHDTVEITHEALMGAWPRLRAWIDEDRAGNLLRQELEETASRWDRGKRDAALLIRGSRLDAARVWSRDETRSHDLSPVGRDFLAASGRHETLPQDHHQSPATAGQRPRSGRTARPRRRHECPAPHRRRGLGCSGSPR